MNKGDDSLKVENTKESFLNWMKNVKAPMEEAQKNIILTEKNLKQLSILLERIESKNLKTNKSAIDLEV